MTDPRSRFTARLERTSYKTFDLVYESAGRELRIELEASGVPEYDLVGLTTDLERWTAPAGRAVGADERARILADLAEWSAAEGVRIHFGPPVDPEELARRFTDAGWTSRPGPDGATVWSRPPGAAAPPWSARAGGWVGRVLRRLGL